tara:strand:- start:277 stop:579 length:303 start_codon:yes stop_codon:yes gene_type:complete
MSNDYSKCSHCDGSGIRLVIDNTHDVTYKEECYCVLQNRREQEILANRIANVFLEKVSKEKLAIVLASAIASKHTDAYSKFQLGTLVESKNDAWLLNWLH